ncbi:cyclophilin-like domain-containing protein [Pavlovales sp. CCMP2436]|nr:cyclophilin-like domain-containing protein [Pavlovales sp. CCMP2436]
MSLREQVPGGSSGKAMARWLLTVICAGQVVCGARAAPMRAASRAVASSPRARARMLFGFGGPPPPQATVTDRCFLDVKILSANGEQKFDVGRLELALYGEVAPKAVERFKQLVSTDGASPAPLTGLTFHRTLKDFIVQSGAVTDASAFAPFSEVNELVHLEGALSMSRDDGGMCATEFFVAVRAAPECDGSYTVFGQATGGMKEVVKDMNRRAGSVDGSPWCGYEISNCGML